MSPYLLGIDSGLTVTKAVVFDEEGRQKGVGAVNNAHRSPRPRWVEQDMDGLWESCAGAIRHALEEAGVGGNEIAGVGVTGHGDGIYLVDEGGPRPGRRPLARLQGLRGPGALAGVRGLGPGAGAHGP